MLPLPSSFTRDDDPHYLCMPPKGLKDKVIESDEEWKKCGKWILYNADDVDMAWIDKVWIDLQVLLKSECLIMLKASTAANKDECGVVLCFTRPGKEEAKRAAEAIRRIVDYECMMYYKTSNATDSGIAFRHGHQHVTAYMHSFQGRFYVKDSSFMWKLEGDNEEELNRNLIDRWKPCDFGFEELPSKSKELQLKHPLKRWNVKAGGWWDILCSLEETGNGLTEADRVWMVAKKFCDEGVFTKINSITHPETASTNIYCYVDDYSDINSLIKIADDFLESIVYKKFMYFRIAVGSKNKIKFVYTSEKELYENNISHNKFLLQN